MFVLFQAAWYKQDDKVCDLNWPSWEGFWGKNERPHYWIPGTAHGHSSPYFCAWLQTHPYGSEW